MPTRLHMAPDYTDEEEGFSQKLRIDVVGMLIFHAVVLYLFATSLL